MFGWIKRTTAPKESTKNAELERRKVRFEAFRVSLDKLHTECLEMIEGLQALTEGSAKVAAHFLHPELCQKEERPGRVEFLNRSTKVHNMLTRNIRDALVTRVVDKLDVHRSKLSEADALIAETEEVKREYDYYAVKVRDLNSSFNSARQKELSKITRLSVLDKNVIKNNARLIDKMKRNQEKMRNAKRRLDKCTRKVYGILDGFENEFLDKEYEAFVDVTGKFFEQLFKGKGGMVRKSSIVSRMATMAKKSPPPSRKRTKKPVALVEQVSKFRNSGEYQDKKKKKDDDDGDDAPPLPPTRSGSKRPKRPKRIGEQVSTAKIQPSRPPRRKTSLERKADRGREMIRLSLGKSDELIRARSRQSVRFSTTTRKRGVGAGHRGVGRTRKSSAVARKRISMKTNWRQSLAIRDAAISKLHKSMHLNVMSEQKKPVAAPKRLSIKLESSFEESNASALYVISCVFSYSF